MVKIYFSLITLFLSSCVIAQSGDSKNIFDVARSGTLLEAKTLFQNNPKVVNEINTAGYSALILACYRGNTEVAAYLINNGADINYNNEMGTPLLAAVVKNNLAIVTLLLKKGINIEAKDANGTTALIYATMFKNHEISRLLIGAKANFDTKDNRGNSALDYAILADDDQLIQILKTQQK
jgi:ankyrin repeat protein